MKNKRVISGCLAMFFVLTGLSGARGASVATLPESEDFQSGELPHYYTINSGPPYYFLLSVFTPWSFTTNGTARTAIAADTTQLETYNLAGTESIALGGSRVKGAYYSCDSMVVLNSQSIKLGRSSSTEVSFMVYESTTSNGTYSVISSNVVTVATGTNDVSSGEINVVFEAGKYYLVAAGWDNSSTYSYQSSASFPRATTTFGDAFNGYTLSSYPPVASVSDSETTSLYFQSLEFSTNAVVRMDSALGGTYATNSMDLAVNLSGYSDVKLEFRYRDASDEDEPLDGIFLSNDNGASFTQIEPLSDSASYWKTKVLDIDALASSRGLSLNSTTIIRFQQYDNQRWEGHDGREFDDIKLYSKPDLEAISLTSGGSSARTMLWKGFDEVKEVPMVFRVVSRGGGVDYSNPSVLFSYWLRDSGSASQEYEYDMLAWSIDAMLGYRSDSLSHTLSIPASEHLSDLNYTVRGFTDALGTVDEALENNQTMILNLTVNHYSGWLWFDNVKVDVDISDWGTRVADSASEHWITGTGVLSGESFSFTELAVDKDLATLDYHLDETESATFNLSFPDRYSVSGVTYWRLGGVALSKNGAYSHIKVLLPAGLGVSTTSATDILDPVYDFGTRKLGQGLYPASSVTDYESLTVIEESKPIGYDATLIRWTPYNGKFTFGGAGVWSVRDDRYTWLENAEAAGDLISPSMAIKKSNAAYYRNVSHLSSAPVVETSWTGAALMNVTLEIDPVAITTHFPYGISQEWSGSSVLVISQDLIDSSASELESPSNFTVSYNQDCNGAVKCSGLLGQAEVSCDPSGNSILSANGGFRTPVDVTSGLKLAWGSRLDDSVTQSATGFEAGQFFVAGHFFRGWSALSDAIKNRGPAEILLSGMASAPMAPMESPRASNYADGFADYAGLNLRVGEDAFLGRSIVGGVDTGDWKLTDRSKYYLRYSGISGIHEAIAKTFPSTLEIYEYPFEFSNYGLSYLSGTPRESRINGGVSVPEPCFINMSFENLMLNCLGELEEAELANAERKTLQYWDADIQPLTLFFAPVEGADCGTSERKLCMGLTTQCANIDQVLSGVLAFLPSGELGTPADQIQGVPSRLVAPNQIELAGPGDETYYFNPVANPYYNTHSLSGESEPGWINFAGNLDVSFFNDLQVHFHTSASTNSAIANIYMMGGWTNSGRTYFNSDPDEFDENNRGMPSVASLSSYRTPSVDDETYLVHALRTWLGVIDFDYPLVWSSATKSFKSPKELEEDLLVVQVQHQTDYLSADNTEISFGLQYDGVPQINLANMAFNAVDEATGMMSAFTDSVADGIHGAIDDGMSSFEDTLSDLPEMLFDPVFDELLDPMVDEFYTDLYVAYTNAPDATDYGSVVTQYLYGVAGPTYDNVGVIISNLANAASSSVNLINDIDRNLENAVQLINAFADVVSMTNGVSLPPGSGINGLLSVDGGDYQQLTDLGIGILETLSETLYDSIKGTVEEELTEVLSSVAPSLASITEVLMELRDVIQDVQGELAVAGSFATELSDLLHSPLVSNTLDTIAEEIMRQMESLSTGDSTFDEYTPEEVKAMLRRYITDAFYGSVPCANVQQVIRSQLYEVEAMVQESIDSVFQQLNKAMKDLVSEYVAEIDTEMNEALGDLSDIMGAGQIDGYAHIRHDSLNELRLDGAFQWKVPDEMEFNAFLVIKDLNSTMPGGCGVVADSLPEVTLGTTDFGLSMMGSDIRADISTKFAFAETDGSLRLIGMGGSFEMTEGEMGFESFVIDKFYADVAFGALENYLSANIRCSFTSYEVEGGIFLGKACSLTPFSWDPDVQAVLGEPPFLGVYVYGEGWMPIVDYGCLFRVKAGVGAGIFAFVDGPVGGKIFLGADGEALCVVNVSGEVTLIGVKDGDDMRMNGKGKISGRAGSCPFCVKFSKTVTISYDNGDWDADY